MSTENVSGILFLVQSACLERRFLDDPALSIEQLNCGQIRISFSLTAGTDLDHRGKVRSSVIYRLLESVLQISAVSVGVEAETLTFCSTIVKYTAAQTLYAACNICD